MYFYFAVLFISKKNRIKSSSDVFHQKFLFLAILEKFHTAISQWSQYKLLVPCGMSVWASLLITRFFLTSHYDFQEFMCTHNKLSFLLECLSQSLSHNSQVCNYQSPAQEMQEMVSCLWKPTVNYFRHLLSWILKPKPCNGESQSSCSWPQRNWECAMMMIM